jgi:hypothetical protein
MDETKIVADFLAKNLEKILTIGYQAFGKADEIVQIKLRTAYRNYLSNTREKYSKAKSFFIRSQSVDLYSYYVPTGISCAIREIDEPRFRYCIENSSRIVITGSGGSGKSVLIKHLFLDCIEDKTYVPILIELRDLNGEDKSLDEFISFTLDIYGFDTAGDYVSRAKQAGHFCFFLDGFDELNLRLRKPILKQISALSNKFPQCPIFISTRPDDTFSGLSEFSIFQMEPLSLLNATQLVSKLPFDADIKTKFITALVGGLFERHESFLSNPLLLSIMLLTYGENAEIPSKLSIFYNQAYEALFQRHDAIKGGYSRERRTPLDIQDFSRVFSLFSLLTYERSLFKISRTECLKFLSKSRDSLHLKFESEDYLSDLLSAACLMIEDGLELAFSHRSFQEYFVALYISSAPPDVQKKLMDRYLDRMESDEVIHLLYEINPDLVERALLVPRLEKFFVEIGVKRTVGVTHAARYAKKCVSCFRIGRNGLYAILSDDSYAAYSLVGLTVEKCTEFKFPKDEVFAAHASALIERHGSDIADKNVDSPGLSVRSPLLLDIVSGPGTFSVEYLAQAFSAFKRLKTKHSNTVANLDTLLGIR